MEHFTMHLPCVSLRVITNYSFAHTKLATLAASFSDIRSTRRMSVLFFPSSLVIILTNHTTSNESAAFAPIYVHAIHNPTYEECIRGCLIWFSVANRTWLLFPKYFDVEENTSTGCIFTVYRFLISLLTLYQMADYRVWSFYRWHWFFLRWFE